MSKENKHPLHREIGERLESELKDCDNIEVIRDTACGGKQRIPLFLTEDKSNDNKLCNVDIMILKNNEIKIIIEIEESNLKPTQILGKLFTSIISKYYIHHTKNNQEIGMANNVCFIQVLDTKDFYDEYTKKPEQWEKIKEEIKKILAIEELNFSIKTYEIFHGELSDKLLKRISNFIKEKLAK